ncbi:hypothetical protein CDN99_07680 [Roseateles aquatilis]|uniref:Uncharacterized protein n=1 Tax=Roseateles aquatilis TaxID=431061 RepID=A0A246JI22_9BURK|nr:hypothetical protein [Roseateles aquatilis]OWQ92212.1 hypothetical protein CDN99_07680 [Roseateles aquatilis]
MHPLTRTSSTPSGATSDTPEAAPGSPLTDEQWVFVDSLKEQQAAQHDNAAESVVPTFATRFPRDLIAKLASSAKAPTGIFRKTERDAGFARLCEASDALAAAPKDDVRAAAREVIRRARAYLDTTSADVQGLLTGAMNTRVLPSGRRRPVAIDNAFHAKAMWSAASKALGASIDQACGYPEAMRIDAPYRAQAVGSHALAMSREFASIRLPIGSTVTLICDASGQPIYARRAASDASIDRDLLGDALLHQLEQQTRLAFGRTDLTLHGHPTEGLALLSPVPALAPAFRVAITRLGKGDTNAQSLLREASLAALSTAPASTLQRAALCRLFSLDFTSRWQDQIQQADGHFWPLNADRGFPEARSLEPSLDALQRGDLPALFYLPCSEKWDEPIDAATASALARVDVETLRETLLSFHPWWIADLRNPEIDESAPAPCHAISKDAVLQVVASVGLVRQLLREAPTQSMRQLLRAYTARIADHLDAQALNWADSVDPLNALLPEDALRVIDADGHASPADSID